MACHATVVARAPPAKITRELVRNSRPAGCAASSGIETGVLKWQVSCPTTRWPVSTIGMPDELDADPKIGQLGHAVQHLALDLDLFFRKPQPIELGLQRRHGVRIRFGCGRAPCPPPLREPGVAAVSFASQPFE